MRDESPADAALHVRADHDERRPAWSTASDVGDEEAGGRELRRVPLERAHKSVGPQGEAPLGAPRSGSA
jgi:hypothetical protein